MTGTMTTTTRAMLAAGLVIFVSACGGDETEAAFTLPGDRVFPEGIACDHATGDLYVGSTEDGSVFRGNVDQPGELTRYLEPGVDGRDAVTGLKVDDEGRLFVAGRDTGRVFVYDTETSALIRSFETAEDDERALVNDITFAGDAAYVTDSFRPVLFRIPLETGDVGDIEPWLDLEGLVPYDEGFNLNGITSTDDGRYLVAVHADRGELYRIDTATRQVAVIDLGGADLTTGDGLLLDGTTLFAVVTEPEPQVIRLELAADALSAVVVDELDDPSFAYPTTLAQCGTDRIQVVNSQLDRAGDGNPELPFTVSDLPVDIG